MVKLPIKAIRLAQSVRSLDQSEYANIMLQDILSEKGCGGISRLRDVQHIKFDIVCMCLTSAPAQETFPRTRWDETHTKPTQRVCVVKKYQVYL